eukprot:CAMPEP_0179010206 /NCGR_PEP_ID=MMETSP0795-20121207/16677_1 /TAXON_ID=88552 /ORGANISM="Amoebophrya sp., Strain Ameob2" /LENGTH=1350 /DNA_ID=CAMNT_0020705445 /DNA_START=68 /DNA_END=4122 /DNA_ORIENTATION=-
MVEIPTRGRRCRASGPTLGTEYGEPAPSAIGAGRARELDFLPVFPDGGAPGAAPRVGTTGLAAANKKPGSFPVPSVRGGSGPQHRGTSSGRINRILEAAKLRKPVAPPSLKAVVLGVSTTKSASGAAPDGFSAVAPGLVAETAATVAATSRNSNKGFKPAAPASRSQSEQAPGGTDNTSYTITNTPAAAQASAAPASSSASTRPGARPIVASAKMRRREEGRSSSSILASIRNLIQQRTGSRGGPRPPCSAPSATTATARDMQGPRPPSASQRRPPRPKSGNQQRRAVPSLPSSSKESSHASSASAKGPPPDTSTEKRQVGYAYSPHSKETACSMTSMEKEVFEVPPPPDLSCWAAATAIASAEAMISELNNEKLSQPSPSAAPPAPQEFEATAAGTTSENATSSCSPAVGGELVAADFSLLQAATSGGADEVSDDSMKAVVGTAGTEAETFSPSLAAEPQPTLFSTPVAPTSSSATAAAGGGPRKRQSVGFKTATFPEDGPEGPRGADIDTVTEGAAAADGSTRAVSARGASSRTPREATTSASPTARQIVERTRRRERERDAADKTRGTAAAVSVPPTSGSAGVASRRQERQASPLTSAFGGEGRSFGFVGSAGGATSGASNSSIKRLKSPTRQMQSGGYLGSSLPASEYDVMLSSMQLCEVVDPKTGKPKIVPKSEAARNAAKDGGGGACSDPHAAAAAARVNAQRQRELACRQRQTTERLAMPIAQQTKRLKLGFGEASPVPQPRELPPMIYPTGNFVTTATSAAAASSSRPGTPGWVSHLRQKATQGQQVKTPTKQYARVTTPGHRYPPGTPGARISGRPASSGAATSSRGGVGRPVSRGAGGGGNAAADGSSRKGRSRSSGGWQKKSFTFYTIDGSPRRSSPTYSAGGRGYRGTGDARLDFSAEHFRVPTMEERRMWAARERQAQMEESVRKREAERTEKITELLRNLAQHGESVRKGVAAVAEEMENAAGEDPPTEEVGAAPRLQEFSEEYEEVCRKEAPQETMVDVRTDDHDDEEYAADFDEDDPSSDDKAPAAEGASSVEQHEEADKVAEKESSAEASCSDADEDALDERDDHEDNDPGENEPKPMCLQEKQTVRNRLQDELRALEAAAIAKQDERKPAAGGSSLPSAPSSPQNQNYASEEISKDKRGDDCYEDDALPLDSTAVEDLVQQARERAKLRQQDGANSSNCASGSAFGADDDDITGAGSATTAQGDDDGENDTETRDEDGVHEIPLYCRFLQPADPIYMQFADFDPKSVPATSLMKLLNQSGTWYHEDPFEQPPGDTRCLCRDLNESFVWVEDDLPESEPEEPPPEYYQEQEMMRQYYEQQQEAGGGVRRAASF